MVPCKSTAEEVSFNEWSHHRILSTDPKVRITLHDCRIDSGRERVRLAVIAPFQIVEGKQLYQLQNKYPLTV